MFFISKNIAVVFGGVSNENEISVITGTMVANVLKNGGDKVFPLYISQEGEFYTGQSLADIKTFKDGGVLKCKRAQVARGGFYTLNVRGRPKTFQNVDVAVNCCHGGWGEGGGICGLFAANGIPLASAGTFESSGFIDKYYTKLILSALGVNTVPYVCLKSVGEAEKCGGLEFPLIVKPVTLGSSIGVEKAENAEELKSALECAFTYDGAAVVEKFLADKRDINCAAYYADGQVITSECEEVFSGGELLSFEDKYCGGGKSVLPADIPPPVAQEIKNISRNVYSKLGMRGIVRFDFILSGDSLYVSEVNTVPGSLSYYLLSGGFKDFNRVLRAVIGQAEKDFAEKSQKKLIKTGILNAVPAGGIKTSVK